MASRIARSDWLLLIGFCLVLFGYQMFSGRALSLHEARLPQLSREMYFSHHWFLPLSAGRPWLERPPVPHWFLVGTSMLLGQACDSEWVVRLPSVIMGTGVVLLTAWMASVLFGRTVGLLAGFVLATMYEFYAYSILAEDDIFLAAAVAAVMALFVRVEFDPLRSADRRLSIFGNRPWELWLLFFLLGAMNLIKSPLIGPIVVVSPIALFILSSGDMGMIRRYAWFWGIILFLPYRVWIAAAIRHYPDVVDNWRFDYTQTHEYDEKFYYYPVVLAGLCMPWIWAAIPGLMATFHKAWTERRSAERFVWCWALVPLLVLSIPHRKHHHYYVPSLAPWTILAAIGLTEIGKVLKPRREGNLAVALAIALVLGNVAAYAAQRRLPEPRWAIFLLANVVAIAVALFLYAIDQGRWRLAMGACFVGIGFAYCWGQSFAPDLVAQDTAFLRRADREAPLDALFCIDGDLGGGLDFFRNQFYVRRSARLLHNLSYLRDRSITAPDAWIIARRGDRAKLSILGEVQEVDASSESRREKSTEMRFVLYHLRFKPDLQRYPLPPYVDTLQAMGRRKGPWCGPPL